jgi:hypothetical protein
LTAQIQYHFGAFTNAISQENIIRNIYRKGRTKSLTGLGIYLSGRVPALHAQGARPRTHIHTPKKKKNSGDYLKI